MLDAERDRLGVRIAELQDELARVVADADARTAADPDSSDAGSADVERDRVTALLAAAREGLAQVRAAVRRADAGTWGVCVHCGQTISSERLAALPMATACVACARPGLRRGFGRR
ncbi:MAG: TraR/DksA family transcriptional regulator [Acidimicrobiales bacterium]